MTPDSLTEKLSRSKVRGRPCAYCSRLMTGDKPPNPLSPTRDHYYPRSKHPGLIDNIVWCCFFCNQVKGDRSPEAWQRFMARNPEFWLHPYFTGKPKVKAPTRIKAPPLEETRAFLRAAAARSMKKPAVVPIEYEDAVAQAAFEAVYKTRLYLLRVPTGNSLSESSTGRLSHSGDASLNISSPTPSIGDEMAEADIIQKIADVARAVGRQAGVGASETAGMIVSCLSERPELIERFMVEGSGLIIEGEISADKGCLTFHRLNGDVTTPQQLRAAMQVRDIKKTALAPPSPDKKQDQG